MLNYHTIPLSQFQDIIARLRQQEAAATDKWKQEEANEREAFCQWKPDEPACGANPLYYKQVVNLFGDAERDFKKAESKRDRAWQELVAIRTNRERAEAAYAARMLGNPPHPETLEERKPEDVRPTTTEFPCDQYEQGYEYCDRYGKITNFLGIKTPDDCVRREECRLDDRKKKIEKSLVIGLVAAGGIIAGLLIWKKKT